MQSKLIQSLADFLKHTSLWKYHGKVQQSPLKEFITFATHDVENYKHFNFIK